MLTNAQVRDIQAGIEAHAVAMGFDFFPIVYEMCSHETISEVAAYGGFPSRYPHWSFGMEYERLAKGYGYGLQKIYEMVINTDPVYAYLLDVNQLVDQQLVIAHVCGHAHFFKHNYMFGPTNRKMLDEMANHAVRIRRYMSKYGVETVENFIDCCLTVDDLIDLHAPFIKRSSEEVEVEEDEKEEDSHKLKNRNGYMRDYINPPDFLAEQKQKRRDEAMQARKFPPEPQKDVLQFLLDYAPLEPWQRDVLDIIREEAYYFAPQGQTKIMNEGCACWAHTRLMTKHVLTSEQVVDYADHHSGTVANHPGRINPYRLGLALLNDIENRWNKGQFGKEWEDCDDWKEKKAWNKDVGLGKEKVFEVWQHFNDVSFLDEFLTPEFVAEHMMFGYEFNSDTEMYEIATRDFKAVKEKLLWGLTNHGRPFIYVADGNYQNRGELLLWHRFEGKELKIDEAKDVLRNVQAIWGRPVHLETIQEEKTVVLSYDGELKTKS
ncbi:MAG TPA: SpoVR family protein [Abditibacterium sp.]|jgi:stage V sporulation protein R